VIKYICNNSRVTNKKIRADTSRRFANAAPRGSSGNRVMEREVVVVVVGGVRESTKKKESRETKQRWRNFEEHRACWDESSDD